MNVLSSESLCRRRRYFLIIIFIINVQRFCDKKNIQILRVIRYRDEAAEFRESECVWDDDNVRHLEMFWNWQKNKYKKMEKYLNAWNWFNKLIKWISHKRGKMNKKIWKLIFILGKPPRGSREEYFGFFVSCRDPTMIDLDLMTIQVEVEINLFKRLTATSRRI